MSIDPIQLEDRILWPDGSSSVSPRDLDKFLMKLPLSFLETSLFVTEVNKEIISYNQLSDIPIKIKTEVNLDGILNWNIPDRYKYIDLEAYLFSLVDKIEKDELYEERLKRFSLEYSMFQQIKLDDILKCLIYIIDTLVEKNVLWGVGRGSSCSSYILYLMDLHLVDVVKYDVAITDFIKEDIYDE